MTANPQPRRSFSLLSLSPVFFLVLFAFSRVGDPHASELKYPTTASPPLSTHSRPPWMPPTAPHLFNRGNFSRDSFIMRFLKPRPTFHLGLATDELRDFFTKFGNVADHEIILDHATKRSRGFGFVVYDSERVVDDLLVDKNIIGMNGSGVSLGWFSYVGRQLLDQEDSFQGELLILHEWV